MRYVDGFVLPIPTKKIDEYKKLAKEAAKMWIRHGALEYVECVGDDLDIVKSWNGVSFADLSGRKKSESVIFAFIIYKSRKHRDQVNKRVHKECAEQAEKNGEEKMPFDVTRMACAGFKGIVDMMAEKK